MLPNSSSPTAPSFFSSRLNQPSIFLHILHSKWSRHPRKSLLLFYSLCFLVFVYLCLCEFHRHSDKSSDYYYRLDLYHKYLNGIESSKQCFSNLNSIKQRNFKRWSDQQLLEILQRYGIEKLGNSNEFQQFEQLLDEESQLGAWSSRLFSARWKSKDYENWLKFSTKQLKSGQSNKQFIHNLYNPNQSGFHSEVFSDEFLYEVSDYLSRHRMKRLMNSTVSLHSVQVLITSGGAHHRSRDEMIMATYGSDFAAGNFIIYSDHWDNEIHQNLPIFNLMPELSLQADDKIDKINKEMSEIKYVRALIHSIIIGLLNGKEWFLMIDDDAFTAPRNILRLIKQLTNEWQSSDVHRSQPLHFYGQRYHFPWPPCAPEWDATEIYTSSSSINPECFSPDFERVSGGAGFLLTSSLALELLSKLNCCFEYNGIPSSDVFLSRCILDHIQGAKLIDRKEFNSGYFTLPEYNYEIGEQWETRRIDVTGPATIRPHKDVGKAVTFHYVKPAKELWNLYRMYRAFRDEAEDRQKG
jgi:hypothetical protein